MKPPPPSKKDVAEWKGCSVHFSKTRRVHEYVSLLSCFFQSLQKYHLLESCSVRLSKLVDIFASWLLFLHFFPLFKTMQTIINVWYTFREQHYKCDKHSLLRFFQIFRVCQSSKYVFFADHECAGRLSKMHGNEHMFYCASREKGYEGLLWLCAMLWVKKTRSLTIV
jgi:hypothetical protein